MNRQHRIEMVFYSHPWNLHLLSRSGILTPGERHMLVEVATESTLAILSEQVPRRAPGTIPLLRQPGKLDFRRIARVLPQVGAPIVVAPMPAVPKDLLMASLMVLDTQPVEQDVVMLVLPASQAEFAAPLFPMVDRFRILWDVADYPNRDLVACTEVLHEYGNLTEERWGGVTLCNHWLRKSDAHEENRIEFQYAIDEAAV